MASYRVSESTNPGELCEKFPLVKTVQSGIFFYLFACFSDDNECIKDNPTCPYYHVILFVFAAVVSKQMRF